MDDSYFSPKPLYVSSVFLGRFFGILLKLSRLLGIEKSHRLPPDCFYTPHNKQFSLDKSFSSAYLSSVESINSDYRIPWRVHQLLWAIQSTSQIDGVIVELGTGKGFMMKSAAVYMADKNIDKAIHLFDVFQKPSISGFGKEAFSGVYASSLNETKLVFKSHPNCIFHEGDVRKTVKPFVTPVSFLHLDLNEPEIELEMLKHFYPLMAHGSLILLDDFANRGFEQSFKMHTNFFEDKGLSVLTTPAGQGIVLIP